MDFSNVSACRVCGGSDLVPCVDIGRQYLSSIFPTDLSYRATLHAYPLELVLCAGPTGCGLLQLAHVFDLSGMYEAYPYQSATNPSMRAVLQDVATGGLQAVNPQPGEVVLDIGCNDCTMLSMLANRGLTLCGIDAAQNITSVFDDPSLRLSRGLFTRERFAGLGVDRPSLIFSIAMFYHLDAPVAFSADVAAVLAPGGTWIVQMAYLPAMLTTNMYDNIVHEHAGYYTVQSLQAVMQRAGLDIYDVELNDVYGGSVRAFIQHAGGPRSHTDRLASAIAAEARAGLGQVATYRAFAERVDDSRRELRTLLDRLRREGRRTWIYGASTKGNTIAQYCGLTADDTPYAADTNPFKWGKYLIGTDIPIVTEAELREAKPDYLLALPYSFVDGFLAREAALVAGGSRFIVPLPTVTLRP